MRALNTCLNHITTDYKWTIESICKVNCELLVGTRLEQQGGKLRKTQNWIGGNRVNPVGAVYVPPEPENVTQLMEDLVVFLNTTQLPPIAAAALAHAQLETIHPFADGNGRCGRALIHMVFKAAGLARTTVPPVSLILATDKERYIANLSAYRSENSGSYLEACNNWIEYFSNAVLLSCEKAEAFEKELSSIKVGWTKKMKFRAGSAGSLLLDVLPGTPAISIKTAQALTNRSYPAACSAVLALQEAGILYQNSKNRKSGIYVAHEILNAFNSYERALATSAGDTSVEKPKRPVPQRHKSGN